MVMTSTGNSNAVPFAIDLSLCHLSSIRSHFNGTPIGGNDYIWFNSVVKVSGQGTNPVTICCPDSTVDFTANSTSYQLPVPSSVITCVPTARSDDGV